MADQLVATIEQRRSGARVIKLAGVLDEHNHLNQIAERFNRGSVIVLDLAGVERINSTGVRDWVDWLSLLDVMGVTPVVVACSPAFVAQMNRIKNFAGNAIVKSFEAPYHCATCRRDRNVLLQVADMKNVVTRAPGATCETCGTLMRFAEEAAVYFAFVRDVRESGRHRHSEVDAELARGSETDMEPQRDAEVMESTPPQPVRVSLRPSMAMRAMRRMRPSLAASPTFDERPWLLAVIAVLLTTLGVLLVIELT